MMKPIIYFLVLIAPFSLHSQATCPTVPFSSLSLIPNPSFDTLFSNPCTSGIDGYNGLELTGWIPLTYPIPLICLNSCSKFVIPDDDILNYILGNQNAYFAELPTVPQPIPNGSGIIAVYDWAYDFQVGGDTPYHKSYAAAGLTNELYKDSLYRLDFFVGFGGRSNNNRDYFIVRGPLIITLPPQYSKSPEAFTLYGNPKLMNPQINSSGCPAGYNGWIPLGSVIVKSDTPSWVKTSIQFKPTEDISSIAIGPSCDTIYQQRGDTTGSKYAYFLDDLQFYKADAVIPVVSLGAGSYCDSTVTLQVQPASLASMYHINWFKNDSLIQGENSTAISVNNNQYGQGFYQCELQNNSVCINSDSFYVYRIPTPSTLGLGAEDTIACEGDTVLLNAYLDSSATYLWQNGSSLPFFMATANGAYNVTISNVCGAAILQKNITFKKCYYEIFVPNAFTPNGNGVNDTFKPLYYYEPKKFSINIYNRYGQLLFSSVDPGKAWDGRYKSEMQPAGVYVWLIEFTDYKGISHSQKGTVVLIR